MTEKTTTPQSAGEAPDAFLYALREAPRPAFAAALYQQLTTQETAANRHDRRPLTLPAAGTMTVAAPGSPRTPHPWRTVHPAVTLAATVAVLLSVLALVTLLLRGGNTPAALAPATPVAANARVLYAGILIADRGIIAVEADGSRELMLAAGDYNGVAPTSDGSRFLAFGARFTAEPTAAIDLYTAAGTLLRHYEIPGLAFAATWAPDNRHAIVVSQTGEQSARQFHSWVVDEQQVREILPGGQPGFAVATGAHVWSAQGRLVIWRHADTSNLTALDLWTVNGAGDDAQPFYNGPGIFIGWANGNKTGYIIEPQRLLAIDERTGQQRVITTVEAVGRQLRPATPGDELQLPLGQFGLSGAQTLLDTPNGVRFALWLNPARSVGSATPPAPYLAIVDQWGQVLGQYQLEPGTSPVFASWNPNASYLACGLLRTDGLELVEVLATPAGGPVTLTIALPTRPQMAEYTSPRWSPDGRTLAVDSLAHLLLLSGPNLSTRWQSQGTPYTWPAWINR